MVHFEVTDVIRTVTYCNFSSYIMKLQYLKCILTRFFFSKIKVEKNQFSNEIYQSGTQWPTDLVTWYTMRGLIPPSPGRNRVKTQLYRHLRFPFSVHMKYALITHEGNRWFVHLMVSIGMAVFWKKKTHSGLPGVIRLIWEKIVPWVFLTNRNI